MLSQLLLAIGLPAVLLPLLTIAAFYIARRYRANMAAAQDVEMGKVPRITLTPPSLRSNSVQVPQSPT